VEQIWVVSLQGLPLLRNKTPFDLLLISFEDLPGAFSNERDAHKMSEGVFSFHHFVFNNTLSDLKAVDYH
jgi:hypothetical protein